jgi:hypothetical protein
MQLKPPLLYLNGQNIFLTHSIRTLKNYIISYVIETFPTSAFHVFSMGIGKISYLIVLIWDWSGDIFYDL